MDEDAVPDVPGDGAGEDSAFDLAADAAEVADVVAVIDAVDVLLDERAGVEVGGDVVGGGADRLDAALVGLGVGFGTDEGRQETVVDVDMRSCQREMKIGERTCM